MKLILIHLLLMLLSYPLIAISTSKIPENTGEKGNLAHWSFDNNFLDSSNNHNDGIAYNGIRFQNNGLNNSINFIDKKQNYVSFQDSNTLDMPDQFSWVVWANWNSNPKGYIPFLWKESDNADQKTFNNPSYGLWLQNDHLHAGILTRDKEWIEAISDSVCKPQGTWHLVCVTYNGKKLEIYYDSILVAKTTGAGGPCYNSSQNLNLGRNKTDDDWLYFRGRMDEIGFYDHTLTPDQIKSIWNSPTGILPETKK